MPALAYGNVIKTPGVTTVFTSESMTSTGTATYFITDRDKSIWDRSVTPTFTDAGIAISTTSIVSIDYLFGRVTLTGAAASSVCVSGNYMPMVERTGFNSHSLTIGGEVGDYTTYENNDGFKRRSQGILDVTMELGGFSNPWVFDFTDCGKNIASTAMSATNSTITMEALHGLSSGIYIKVENEIMLITAVSVNDLTVSRGAWDSNAATHSSETDVYTMATDFYTVNPLMVEFMPGGSTIDVYRGWFKVMDYKDAGEINGFRENTVTLGIDGQAGASFKNGAA
jgi:hypothetical protein